MSKKKTNQNEMPEISFTLDECKQIGDTLFHFNEYLATLLSEVHKKIKNPQSINDSLDKALDSLNEARSLFENPIFEQFKDVYNQPDQEICEIMYPATKYNREKKPRLKSIFDLEIKILNK